MRSEMSLKGGLLAATTALATLAGSAAAAPQYNIIDLGVVAAGDSLQGNGISSDGSMAVGRTLGTSNTGFAWTSGGGIVGLPKLPTHGFATATGANNSGVAVGTATTTFFGSSPLPVMWQNGTVSQLPLPAGEAFGRAYGVNNGGTAVGSVGSGISERGVIYSGGSATIITTPAADGSTMRTAFDITDGGLVIGTGVDPNNAARNVGFVYDSTTNTSFEVGALPGANGALCFGASNAGHVVGSSMMNQGSGMPFVWTQAGGMQAIPLPLGASSGSGRAANSSGWVVGNAGGVFAVPFLFDGTQTYRVQDLIPAGSGWDLSTNTSSSALGISDNGIIVGTGIFNGATRAYAMVPVPTPGALVLFGMTGLAACRRRR